MLKKSKFLDYFMAVPKRKFRAIGNLIKIKESTSKTEEKQEENKITSEEHEKRLNALREMGLIK